MKQKSEFLGQEHIIRELLVYREEILNGENFNFLFQAPSGYGKTTLVERFINSIDLGYNNSIKLLPNREGKIVIPQNKRFIFIDEIHELRDVETIYPILDSRLHTFVFATNEFDKIKEPLVNRCFVYTFTQYSLEELASISKYHFETASKDKKLPEYWYKEMADYGRGNPRITRNIALRIAFIIKQYGMPQDLEGFHDMIAEFLDTSKGGFTALDRQYVNALQNLGGTSSFGVLSGLLNIPNNTIKNQIEPFLLLKKVIKITSKGRELL